MGENTTAEKSKADLKRERREKQERQRAEKAKAKIEREIEKQKPNVKETVKPKVTKKKDNAIPVIADKRVPFLSHLISSPSHTLLLEEEDTLYIHPAIRTVGLQMKVS